MIGTMCQMTNEFLQLMLDPFVNGCGGAGVGEGSGRSALRPSRPVDNLLPDIALAYALITNKSRRGRSSTHGWTAWGQPLRSRAAASSSRPGSSTGRRRPRCHHRSLRRREINAKSPAPIAVTLANG
jgi:hypothetical protein